MKKTLSVILLATVLVAQLTFIFPALTVKSEAAETDNKCGDSATWFVDTRSGVLTIGGTGKTYEYDIGSAPWDKYADYITSIVVSEGITHLLEGTLNKLTKAVSLSLPATIEEIHTTAAMMSLETITFAKGRDFYYVNPSFCNESAWYLNHDEGSLIYFGSLLHGIKGDAPENSTIEIADGTASISQNAFSGQTNITNVIFPDTLKYIGMDAFKSTGWYDSQPDGLVYAGSVLLKYKGTMPDEEVNVVLEDGIKGIAENALRYNDDIKSITIPTTVEEIGAYAFYDCDNLTKVYFETGSTLRKIHEFAFYQCDMYRFEIPDTVLEIGESAFNRTKLRNVYIPASVLMLKGAFNHVDSVQYFEVSPDNPNYCSDHNGVLFNKDKTVLIYFPSRSDKKEYTVPSGVLYIDDYAFGNSDLTSLTFNNELQGTGERIICYSYISKIDFGNSLEVICDDMFWNAFYLKKLIIPKSIKRIEGHALWSAMELTDVYFLSEDVELNLITPKYDSVFHCYADSTAHKYAEKRGVQYVLFDEEHFTVEIDWLLTKTEGIYRPYYTNESLAELDAVLNKIDLNAEGLTQYQIDDWCVELEAAINNLELKSADYAEIEALIEQAEAIDRSLYTDESLAKLDEALAMVDMDLTIENQAQISVWISAIETALAELEYRPVDYSEVESLIEQSEAIDRNLYTNESLAKLDEALAMVDENLTAENRGQVILWISAIEKALAELEYLPADYSEVESEIQKAQAINARYYSEYSLIVLDDAVNSVEYGLDKSEQAKVDGFAASIRNAISALEYASIVLRHDPCGVIVSATTKEIKPDTALAVEKVDSSEHEGTNFAVGGSIRSLHFYDISLVLESQIVQPDGTVTVKIKLADGVDPAKCKVYHVTEDIVNPLVRFANTIDGNYIVFETDHFSEFAVIEVDTVVNSIEITSLPAKTEYNIGEPLDLTGLNVIAYYSDGSVMAIRDYNISMVDMSSLGTKKVTVYYTCGNITKTAEFEITVSSNKCSADITESDKSVERVNKKLGLFEFYSRASVQLGCTTQNIDGCTLRWSSDNSKVLVDESGKVTCNGWFGAKKATISVEVIDGSGNIVASDSITVIFYKLSFQLSRLGAQTADVMKRSFTVLGF